MVFHARDDDLVAGPNLRPAEALGHEVNAFGSAPDEDDLPAMGGVQEALDGNAGFLERLRGPFAEEMYATVYIRIVACVVALQSVDHCLRLLRRGRVVQVDKRFLMHPLM